MRKQGKMRKITVATSLALAVVVGAFLGVGSAMATPYAGTYLGPVTVTINPATPPPSPAFPFVISTSNTNYGCLGCTNTAYATINSTYGATAPSSAYLTSVGVLGYPQSISGSQGPTFYDPNANNGLGLTLVATNAGNPLDSFTNMTVGSVTYSGSVISNVFQVTNDPGSNGDLVFTYQFEITNATPFGNANITGFSVGQFNQPGFSTLYTVGAGINYDSTTGSLDAIGPTFSGTITPPISAVNGTVTYDPGSLTFSGLSYTDNTVPTINSTDTAYNLPYISPQLFVATNATYFGGGTLGFLTSSAGGFGALPVFVPNTPEPSTLVLFATGFGILAFMALRKCQNKILA